MQKITKNVTLAALATVAVLTAKLLFQPSVMLAGEHGKRGGDDGRGDQHHQVAKATFTKWVTAFPNEPGRILDMVGVVGGAVGKGIFTGEVLLYNPGATATEVSHFVAFYHFTGPRHSFTALVDVLQGGSGPGTRAVITGVVTDGWRKGHAVAGEFTEIICGHDGINSPCFEGVLEIDGDRKH